MATRTFSADVTYTGTVTNQGGSTLVSVTTGAATAAVANYGVSIIAATSSEVYTLLPPVPGIQKTIVFTSSSTTITPTVRGSTGQTVTFAGLGANSAIPTMFKLAATRSTVCATVVKLVGQTTAQWIIESVYPVMTTGAGGGAITLSTT